MKVWISTGHIIISPGQMQNIRTGVYLKLPENTWGDIRPRSSTFANRKLFVMGGTIDSGYTGEISIFIWNPMEKPHRIDNGDRLAQLVLHDRKVVSFLMVDELPDTVRGESGFGSTND